MHILQPKHSKLKPEEAKKLIEDLNISLSQLPRIHLEDPGLPEGCKIGDVIKVERKEQDNVVVIYRVVVWKN